MITPHVPTTAAPAQVQVQVQIRGQIAPDIAPFLEQKLNDVLAHVRPPVLHARVRITRHADPAVERPYVVQANLDVAGRFVRVEVRGTKAREAADLLHDRLRRRLAHVVPRTHGNWEDRRGRRSTHRPHEWRHGDEPAHRLPWYPRPADEREIVRHKSVTPARCTVDEAAADMDLLDYDFHLFTEEGTGQDSVLYRSGPTGYRLAQVDPRPQDLAPSRLAVTVSEHAAPKLTTEEAVDRMAAWDQPFLFFLDGDRAQGAVLYHRYDGHYGLITPARSPSV